MKDELKSTRKPQTEVATSIAAAARELVGVPFSHQGRDIDVGLDCAGVLVATFAKLGVGLKEGPVNYRRQPAEAYVRQCLKLNFEPIMEYEAGIDFSPVAPALGRILHIRFNRDSEARHLAIVVERSPEPSVVHATKANRRVLEEPLRGILAHSQVVGVWAFDAAAHRSLLTAH
jgi:cell wall-associated NlpC family hydrolase